MALKPKTQHPTNFNDDQKKKLVNLIQEGVGVTDEIKSLREGLADTISAISEELDLPAGVLKKAVAVAYKSNFENVEADHQLLETILKAVGRN